jgi:hypothetical protein
MWNIIFTYFWTSKIIIWTMWGYWGKIIKKITKNWVFLEINRIAYNKCITIACIVCMFCYWAFQLNNNQLSNKKVQIDSILDRSIFKKQKTEDFWKWITFLMLVLTNIFSLDILYKYILLVRVICEKYWLRGEANIPSRFSGDGHLTVLETGIFRK